LPPGGDEARNMEVEKRRGHDEGREGERGGERERGGTLPWQTVLRFL
jgi:hypothetical protein